MRSKVIDQAVTWRDLVPIVAALIAMIASSFLLGAGSVADLREESHNTQSENTAILRDELRALRQDMNEEFRFIRKDISDVKRMIAESE